MEYRWPLSVPQFSWVDRVKLAKFVLTNNRWTQGEEVKQFEHDMAQYVGVNYAVFTSSGSTANTLLAMLLRDTLRIQKSSQNIVVFPSTTWITSVSPFLREGFTGHFIDVNLNDFSIDLDKLEEFLKDNTSNVACVFVTSLIGFTPSIDKLLNLARKYRVKIMMDNCENTLGKFSERNVSSFFTSTTSTYFGHQIQSVEGGFVFTNNSAQHEYLLMARNHGMLRNLSPHRIPLYRNQDVDERFDFHLLGNNFRNSNLHAFIGLLDLKRADRYFRMRRALYDVFVKEMSDYLILPIDSEFTRHAPFCFPIIVKRPFVSHFRELKRMCESHKIETRPIISGNLLRQTCLRNADFSQFTNSEYLHHFGFYVGLHGSTTNDDVLMLCDLVKFVLSQ